MNGKKSRKGAMMIMLLVVLIIGSIVALQLLPGEELITLRTKETSLNTEISQIREAFDLKKIASPLWEPWTTDPPSRIDIANALKVLADEGYLRNKDLADPTVLAHLWNQNDETFWKASNNLATNSSFQISLDGITAWDWNVVDTTAATDGIYLYDLRVDDYPYQNKLGNLLGKEGSALKITR